jgi:drug/metabolite transporter (DMT)-like permease
MLGIKKDMKIVLHGGVPAAMLAALLFGAGTPLAKLLLAHTSPWLLASLLYLGSGIGLWIVRRFRRAPAVHLEVVDWHWLAGAIVTGGVIAPVLLLAGLTAMPASGASLLLNAEGVMTALLAWFVFKENFDRRIALGMFAIIIGTVLVSWQTDAQFSGIWPALTILGACLAWAIDNNLTRKVSLPDASFIAMTKGLVAGTTNMLLAFITHSTLPGIGVFTAAALLGFASYGMSLTLFVIGLRELGTARTGAYFSIAPFFGALLAIILLNEPVTPQLISAGLLMALGVWLHLTEKHEHEHIHEVLEHDHEHVHNDEHHDHRHHEPISSVARHSHAHRHMPSRHSHPHFPDMHHQHFH